MEPRGIEPLSENPSSQLSPSAVCQLKFPRPTADKQAIGFGSLWYTNGYKTTRRRRSLLIRRQISARSKTELDGSALRQLLKRDLRLRLNLSLRYLGASPAPLAYHASESPSKPLRPLLAVDSIQGTVNSNLCTAIIFYYNMLVWFCQEKIMSKSLFCFV